MRYRSDRCSEWDLPGDLPGAPGGQIRDPPGSGSEQDIRGIYIPAKGYLAGPAQTGAPNGSSQPVPPVAQGPRPSSEYSGIPVVIRGLTLWAPGPPDPPLHGSLATPRSQDPRPGDPFVDTCRHLEQILDTCSRCRGIPRRAVLGVGTATARILATLASHCMDPRNSS